MRTQKEYNLYKSKSSWLRIVEAFISVLLVMGVVLIVVARSQPQTTAADEIGKLQKYSLDYVTTDEVLRSQVLGGYLGGVNDKLMAIIPGNLNYTIRLCNFDEVCALSNGSKSFVISSEVYSDELILFANLTYYNPNNAKKLKLFFWQGNYPVDITPPDYYVNAPAECTPACAGKVCGPNGCGGSCGLCSGTDVCNANGACISQTLPTAVLDLRFSGTVYSKVGIYTHYTHNRTFIETNGVGVTLTQGQVCYLTDPKGCDAKGAVSYRINANSNLIQINKNFDTSYATEKFTLTYWGTDDNGHAITVVQKMCVSGTTFTENCV